ncbi:hypothetical protein Vretimale_5262, partial [Volvox reticuliferus]
SGFAALLRRRGGAGGESGDDSTPRRSPHKVICFPSGSWVFLPCVGNNKLITQSLNRPRVSRSSNRSSVCSAGGGSAAGGGGGVGGGLGGSSGPLVSRVPAVSTLKIFMAADGMVAATRRNGNGNGSGSGSSSTNLASNHYNHQPQQQHLQHETMGRLVAGDGDGGGGAAAGGHGAAGDMGAAGSGGSVGSAAAAMVCSAGDSGLQAPVGVAVDFSGCAYIADTGNCRILRIRLDTGEAVVLAGGGGYGHKDGPGRKAKFACPMYLALDHRDGSLVVSDQHCLRRVASDGFVTTVAGTTTPGHADGPAGHARFYNLRGVSVDGDGNIFVADSSNHCVRQLTAADSMVSTLVGSPGNAGFKDGAGADARFRNPCGVAVNLQDGMLVVADAGNNRLRKVDRDRLVTTIAGNGVAGPPAAWPQEEAALQGHLNHPQGVAIDGDGNILLSDLDNRCVRLVSPAGIITALAGNPAAGPERDEELGPPSFATGSAPQYTSFCDPQGIAVTHRGEVLVVECSANRVRVIAARLHSPHTYLAATKSTFVTDMLGLLSRADGTDVTFVVGGEELRAHRWLLAARCECFGRMLASDCLEGRTAVVEVRDCSTAAFREFLRYLYTDQLEFKGDVVLDVLLLGRKYMVGRVFQHCCSQVRRGLCGQNAMAILRWADENRVEELRPLVLRYVLQHLRHILRKYPDSLSHLEGRPDLLIQLLVAQAAVDGGATGSRAAAATAAAAAAAATATSGATGGGISAGSGAGPSSAAAAINGGGGSTIAAIAAALGDQ